jgi:hypothetical protein
MDVNEWQTKGIQEALLEADNPGAVFVDHDEVLATWEAKVAHDTTTDFFPRGRVVYFQQTGKYRLYVDKCLDENEVQHVMKVFGLAGLDIELEPDEHYKCAGCNRHYLI